MRSCHHEDCVVFEAVAEVKGAKGVPKPLASVFNLLSALDPAPQSLK